MPDWAVTVQWSEAETRSVAWQQLWARLLQAALAAVGDADKALAA